MTDSIPMLTACAQNGTRHFIEFKCDLCGGPVAIALSAQAGSTGVCSTCALQYEARGERPPVVKFGYFD